MAVGIPGVGIGGMFYLVSALAMPFRELALMARGARGAGGAARWTTVVRQSSIAGGILAAIWATGVLLGRALRTPLSGGGAVDAAAAHGVSLRLSALLLSFGTLTIVLLLVQLARVVRHVSVGMDPRAGLEAPAAGKRSLDDSPRLRLPLTLMLLGFLALGVAGRVEAQSAGALRAAAERAFDSGDRASADRAYSALIVVAPDDSRALYRLGGLRSTDPGEAVRLYSRYVALEPNDAWGWLALADALGRAGRTSDALRAMDRAERIAPRERDVVLGRARLLGRAMHTDASIVSYERAAARWPRDAELLRELAAQRWRAGRSREAIAALTAAQAATPDRSAARRLAQWRAESRMALEPAVVGTRDSDGNDVRRAMLQVRSPALGRGVASASAGRSRASDAGASVDVDQATLGMQWRPLATTRIDALAGMARLTGGRVGATPPLSATVPTGQVRARWRAPAQGPAIDVRVGRSLLDATPLLARNRVIRSEAAVQLEVPLASVIRLRGIGRAAQLDADGEGNERSLVGGALVRPVAGWGEIAMGGQRLAFARPTTRGYFAPEHAELVEVSSYLERESDGGVTLALDLGAGAQRIAPFGEIARDWQPAFRFWSQLEVPIGVARSIRAELDLYDGGAGQDAAAASSAAHWRWASLSLGMRLGL